MVTTAPAAWHFALTVELRRVFGWHVELVPADPAGHYLHLARAHDPIGRRLTGLGLYDGHRLLDILSAMPPRAYVRGGDPLATIEPARVQLMTQTV